MITRRGFRIDINGAARPAAANAEKGSMEPLIRKTVDVDFTPKDRKGASRIVVDHHGDGAAWSTATKEALRNLVVASRKLRGRSRFAFNRLLESESLKPLEHKDFTKAFPQPSVRALAERMGTAREDRDEARRYIRAYREKMRERVIRADHVDIDAILAAWALTNPILAVKHTNQLTAIAHFCDYLQETMGGARKACLVLEAYSNPPGATGNHETRFRKAYDQVETVLRSMRNNSYSRRHEKIYRRLEKYNHLLAKHLKDNVTPLNPHVAVIQPSDREANISALPWHMAAEKSGTPAPVLLRPTKRGYCLSLNPKYVGRIDLRGLMWKLNHMEKQALEDEKEDKRQEREQAETELKQFLEGNSHLDWKAITRMKPDNRTPEEATAHATRGQLMERKKNVSEKRIAEMRPRTSEGREVVVYVDKTRIKPEEIAQKIGSVVEEHLNELIGPPKRPQTRKNRAWASKRGKKGKEAQEPTRRKALQAGS